MDLGSIPLFKQLTQRMERLGERQDLIARNIANADSPGYKPVDLKEDSFPELVAKAGRLAMTQPTGASGTGTALRMPIAMVGAPSPRPVAAEGEVKISGNKVDLESELARQGEIQGAHQTVINLYRRQVAMLKLALGRAS
ncbi:MAG TPA: flagellar basal body protein [Stellaceae bacterium]|nr:flagellar basal body protein [Stellaceae bacterium]